MEHNGYQQYQEQAIFSMTQNELLLLLLNELIKRLGRCDLALTQKIMRCWMNLRIGAWRLCVILMTRLTMSFPSALTCTGFTITFTMS